jgi:hypothetical protein
MTITKTILVLPLLAACALAQEPQRIMIDKIGAEPVGVGAMLGEAVKGAPYSATIVTEQVQVLADGNRIAQKNQGAVARDSQGRMRHEAILPVIGNMAAEKMPKLVFINDPVAGANYTLNAAEKTYRKMPGPNTTEAGLKRMAETKAAAISGPGGADVKTFNMRVAAPPAHAGAEVHAVGGFLTVKDSAARNESLGSKVIDGVMADGTRSVRTIPAGEIGNEKPIEVVSESWYSPELKTIVYSKRSDPRTGEMTYSLTNINRAEPDASLFAPPADYKAAEASGPKDVFFYKAHE